MSLQARLVVIVLAVAGACAASAPAGTRGAQTTPVVRGYPYASRCPSAGIADVVDRWKMDMCNCTSYVAWALQANGQRIDWFVPGAMDAKNWPHVAESAGLRVGVRPRVGSVAVWTKLEPPFGHVAYVTGVERDGGIDVGEYNAPGSARPFAFDTRDDVSTAGAFFIYVPRARAEASARAPRMRLRVFSLVDRSRTIRLPDGRRVPRRLETVVRYPSGAGPYPLIVFAHGFALTPASYAALLDTWAAAGYVVAAPVFPLTSTNAPGGPSEADLVNQPRDVSFVITSILELNRRSRVLGGKIDPARVAVAGQSDGGITALAAAYDSRYRDRRLRVAIVLSGARLAGMTAFPRRGPALLAVQGTADPLNAPATTAAYFSLAWRPKFLLWLLGASHLPPYTDQQPQLGIVERATVAFLGHYLEGRPLAAFNRAARRPGLTRLVADD